MCWEAADFAVSLEFLVTPKPWLGGFWECEGDVGDCQGREQSPMGWLFGCLSSVLCCTLPHN